jgi:pyruvate dehydrogenase E2 component (dihydrolipoamide acetyltransferase)
VKTGAPLVEFAVEGGAADTGTVVGRLPEAPAPTEAPSPVGADPLPGRAAPAVRALARRLGVDLATVTPTGPEGIVTSADVEKAAEGQSGTVAEPLRGVRYAMAVNMARSRAEVVPATVVDEADVDAWPADTDVTIRLVRAVVAGCRAAPALNAWFDAAAMSRRLHTRIDLGIAVDTGDGLFVPVLRDVGNRSAAGLRRGVDTLKRDVAARKVPLAELHGQTITLSNFGMFAGRFAALAIVPPQAAILGAGRIAPRAVASSDGVAVHRTLPLSLTFDHRVVTGTEAATFLAAAIRDLQQPG